MYYRAFEDLCNRGNVGGPAMTGTDLELNATETTGLYISMMQEHVMDIQRALDQVKRTLDAVAARRYDIVTGTGSERSPED
jgi:hypothetical protein